MKKVYTLVFEEQKEDYNTLHNKYFYNKNPRVTMIRNFKDPAYQVVVDLDLTEEEATHLALSVQGKLSIKKPDEALH